MRKNPVEFVKKFKKRGKFHDLIRKINKNDVEIGFLCAILSSMLRRGASGNGPAAEIKPVEPETDNAGAGIGNMP